jgi:hypothetical protein
MPRSVIFSCLDSFMTLLHVATLLFRAKFQGCVSYFLSWFSASSSSSFASSDPRLAERIPAVATEFTSSRIRLLFVPLSLCWQTISFYFTTSSRCKYVEKEGWHRSVFRYWRAVAEKTQPQTPLTGNNFEPVGHCWGGRCQKIPKAKPSAQVRVTFSLR